MHLHIYRRFLNSNLVFLFGLRINLHALVRCGEGIFVEKIGNTEQYFFNLFAVPTLANARQIVVNNAFQTLDLIEFFAPLSI